MNEYRSCKCINCNSEIESDDNFCHECGHWTSKGYMFLKSEDNIKSIENGSVYKQNGKFGSLLVLTCFGFILFTVLALIRGNDLFKPYFYLKKQVTSYIYGYNSSILKTNNKYNEENINSIEEANEFIKKDFSEQKWQCSSNLNVSMLEYELEDDYGISSVSFCDMSEDEATKISDVIKKVYALFPNMKGSLTNITITNAPSKSEYIAYFQPLYQFVNVSDDINIYNKVNKTQILLNSYYFLNDDIITTPLESVVGENWCVNGATWESTIAHELGHYITFKILLKENNLDNITLVTKDNEEQINAVVDNFDSGQFSLKIVTEALNNYNYKYNKNLSLQEFALSISNYAGSKDENGNLQVTETIAEAIHDYYLHGNNCASSSFEIVKIIKSKL